MHIIGCTLRRNLGGTIHPILLIFIAAVLFVMLPLLGVGPAGGSSEAREMHVASSIVVSGEWILPLRSGLIPSKPPLYHWIVAALYERGPHLWSIEFVARLVSLLSALLILGLTWRLAKRIALCTHSTPRLASTTAGLSVAVLMMTYGFFSMASTAMVDMLYAACVVAAISALVLPFTRSASLYAIEEPVRSSDFMYFYLWCGIGALAKGPLALVLPVLVCIAVHIRLLGLAPAVQLWIRPRWGWLVWLLLAAPWYILAASHGGDGFINRQLVFENIQRFLGGEHVNEQPWWFYFPSLLRTAAPWSLVWCIAVWWQLRGSRGIGPSLRATPASLYISQAPLWWTFAGLALFTLSAGKRHSYLLPLYPAISISVAQCMLHWWVSRADAWRLKVTHGMKKSVPIGILVLALLLLIVVSSDLLALQTNAVIRSFGEFLQRYRIALMTSLLLGGILSYGVYKRMQFTVWPALAVMLFSITAFLVHIGIGFKNNLKNFDLIANTISTRFSGTHSNPIGVLRYRWEEYLDPIMFYLPGEERVVSPDDIATDPETLPDILIAPTWHSTLLSQSTFYKMRARFRQSGDMLRNRSDRAIEVWERTHNAR